MVTAPPVMTKTAQTTTAITPQQMKTMSRVPGRNVGLISYVNTPLRPATMMLKLVPITNTTHLAVDSLGRNLQNHAMLSSRQQT
jgi:hypothetical protein